MVNTIYAVGINYTLYSGWYTL